MTRVYNRSFIETRQTTVPRRFQQHEQFERDYFSPKTVPFLSVLKVNSINNMRRC